VLKHHFDNLEQQHAAERLGMWMFLVTEVMFFGGLFAAYTVYRYYYPAEFEFASSHLILWIAGLNTALLITSSLTMTFAIRAAQLGNKKALVTYLWLTLLLGAGFLGFKALEYSTDVHEKYVPGRLFTEELARAKDELAGVSPSAIREHQFQGGQQHWAQALARRNALAEHGLAADAPLSPERVQLFLCFYYIMTGIHGLHILIGLGCILWLISEARGDKIPRENYSTVEVVSLYWHLVDMIWLFLMPLLYLAGAGLNHGH
jgi:cytochrome c oxidase subunit 3